MFEVDELKIYRGMDIPITDKIIITQPTLGQIEEFGEKRYFQAVRNLTSVGADLKWQLWDYFNTDYTTIEDYDLFIKIIHPMVSSRKNFYEEFKNNPEYEEELLKLSNEEKEEMLINPLSLVLKDIDLADFGVYEDQQKQQMVLYNKERDIVIDRFIYARMIDTVRQIHGFKRNDELPANEITKMFLIDEARDEAMLASKKPYKSVLKPLISALSAKCGQCGDDRIWNMPINMFFDSIKRILRIQDAELLLQGAYSGFASLKGVDKDRLDWTGEI